MSGGGGGFNGVKVFSATKEKDRTVLGETVTTWLRSNPAVEVVDRVVTQSSDDGVPLPFRHPLLSRPLGRRRPCVLLRLSDELARQIRRRCAAGENICALRTGGGTEAAASTANPEQGVLTRYGTDARGSRRPSNNGFRKSEKAADSGFEAYSGASA